MVDSTLDQQGQLGERLGAILKICQKMSSTRERAALLDLIAQEAARLMDADRASIFLLDRDRNELRSTVALGSGETLRFDARAGIGGAVVQSGQTINVTDAHQDPRFYAQMDAQTGYLTRTLLAAPLQNLEGEIVGAFEVLNKRSGVFTDDDEEILKALAAQAAICIETAQMVEELKRHRDQLLQENTQLWKEVEGRFSTPQLLGTGEQIRAVAGLIERISDTSVDVLITGESGTGKEVAAKTIHYTSPRARRPLVALNCAALPESLMETELFGIEKGVATGVERRMGKFEAADGGTLFLDEVGDLSLTAQAKLLRALQERVIERVGGRRAIPVDVRIVAATNKDLEAESKRGRFREDLYYRLKVIDVRMPALREMREDIPLLASYFLARSCRDLKREPKQLSPEALARLANHSWPGNVREMENEMKRLAASVSGKAIREEDLSEGIRTSRDPVTPEPAPGASLKDAVTEIEKRMIRDALNSTRNNQQRAAIALGLSRQGLIKKIKRYGIRSDPA